MLAAKMEEEKELQRVKIARILLVIHLSVLMSIFIVMLCTVMCVALRTSLCFPPPFSSGGTREAKEALS